MPEIHRPSWTLALRPLGMAMLLLIWALAAHYTTAVAVGSDWGTLLGLLPFIVIALSFAWRSPQRPWLLGLCALAGLGLGAVWPLLCKNIAWLYFIQHLGTNVMLGIGFGRTLAPGKTPMISQFAAMVHREMSPNLLRFTRQATWAWTLFFAFLATTSLLLFILAPLEIWSAFANLLTMPLVLTMFAGEFLMRFLCLNSQERVGILATIQACRMAGYFQAHERAK